MDATPYPSPMAHGLTMTNTSLVPSQFSFLWSGNKANVYVNLRIWCLFVWTGQQHSAQRSLQTGIWQWPVGKPLRANSMEVGGEDRSTRECIWTVQEGRCVSGEKFSRCHSFTSLPNWSGSIAMFDGTALPSLYLSSSLLSLLFSSLPSATQMCWMSAHLRQKMRRRHLWPTLNTDWHHTQSKSEQVGL